MCNNNPTEKEQPVVLDICCSSFFLQTISYFNEGHVHPIEFNSITSKIYEKYSNSTLTCTARVVQMLNYLITLEGVEFDLFSVAVFMLGIVQILCHTVDDSS